MRDLEIAALVGAAGFAAYAYSQHDNAGDGLGKKANTCGRGGPCYPKKGVAPRISRVTHVQTHGDNHIHVGGMPDIPGMIIDKTKGCSTHAQKTLVLQLHVSLTLTTCILKAVHCKQHGARKPQRGTEGAWWKKTPSDALNLNPADVHGWRQNWDKGVDDFFSRNPGQSVPNEGAQRQITSAAKWITKSPGKIGEVLGSGVGGIADVFGRIFNPN